MENFTSKELETLYAACMAYGNSLTETARKFPNEEILSDTAANRAEEVYNLARKISDIMIDSVPKSV
jgi:hypothetical protein